MKENSSLDKKSLSIIAGKKADWKELAKDCVCFANGVGGKILIGIEDDDDFPSANQIINPHLIETIQKKISSLTLYVGRLQELIYEDLKNYPESAISTINKRIGEEIKQRTLKAKLDEMIESNLLMKKGEKRWTLYSININQ